MSVVIYLKEYCHEYFQVIVPGLCGKLTTALMTALTAIYILTLWCRNFLLNF